MGSDVLVLPWGCRSKKWILSVSYIFTKVWDTRGKDPLTLARKTFLKIRHMVDLVFNLCVHFPCWMFNVSNCGLASGPSALGYDSSVLHTTHSLAK